MRTKTPRPLTFSLVILFSACGSWTGCATLNSPNSNTLIGTATGSAIGAAIGKESGNPITGAVVGALGGGLVGQSIDNHRRQIPAAAPARVLQAGGGNGISVDEVISLTNSGVSKDLVQNQVRAKGFPGGLTTDQLLRLNQSKVDPDVIRLLQQGTVARGTSNAPNIYPARPPVIYHHYLGPPRLGPRPRRIYRHGYYCEPRFHGPGSCDDFSVHIDL